MTGAHESRKILCEKLCNDLGETIKNFLQESDVHEIMLNPNGEIWIDSTHLGQFNAGNLSVAQAYAIINSVAGIHGCIVSALHPRLEAELPYYAFMQGERFTAIIPPIAPAPCFNIRKRGKTVFTLTDYVQSQRMTAQQAGILRQLIQHKKNILVCGGPGSGKTSIANALIYEAMQLDMQQRFLILEDIPELQCQARNCVSMLTSATISMRDLIHAAMRMRPDRILIGEVRGAEALELLKAWNTGCPGGICTTHANSAETALQRIADLSMEAGLTQPPWTLIKHTIGAVITIVRQGFQTGFLKEIVTT
jgi:type IV secretion system protein TrbB